MIDLRQLDNQTYKDGAIAKGAEQAVLDAPSAADSSRRALLTEVEELRGQSNTMSKEIGQADPAERPAKIEAAGGSVEQTV